MSRLEKLTPVNVSIARNWIPDDLRLQIDLRLHRDDLDSAELETQARQSPTDAELRNLASQIYQSRRKRDRMLYGELFGEPAWDMLLALYCFPSRGELLGVTALSYAANIAPATGHRVQAALAERGLIERQREASDARRQLVSLTDKGQKLLESYLSVLYSSLYSKSQSQVTRS